MKKFLSTLLAFVMMTATVICVPFTVSAETPASGSLGDNITYTFDSETGVMTVTGTGAMKNYSYSQFGNDNTEIKKLIIGEGITDIGDYCFARLTALTEIEFPSTLQTIKFYSFGFCSSLTELSFPDSVTTLYGSSFGYCSSLKKVTIGKGMKSISGSSFDTTSMQSFNVDPENQYYSAIDGNLYNANGTTLIKYCAGKPESEFTVPESVTNISAYAFSDCAKGKSALTKVILPTGLKSLGTEVFRGASSLTEIVLPEGLEKIGVGAFRYCSGLESINFPSSLVSVASYAFEGTNITSLTLPASLTTVDGFSFSRMSYLEEFIVENDNPALKAVDGVLFSKDGKTLIAYPRKKANTSYEIPEGVEIISASAFLNSTITSVTFPSTLKRIEQYGLQASALEGDITIPESVTYIGYLAFQGCNSISSITVSNPYAEINDSRGTLGSSSTKLCSYNKCDGSKSTTEEFCEKYSATFESLGTASHAYGSFVSNGDETHTKVCVNCGDEQTAACTLETLPKKEATCTEAGYAAGERCSVCGYSKEGEPVGALGHDLKIKNETVTAATCTAEGLAKITTTCSRCTYEEVKNVKLPVTKHTPKILEAVSPTCTQDGLTEGEQCSVCGSQITPQIKQLALGHSFTSYVSNGDATCTADGTKTAKCDREACDETDTVTDTGSALGHSFTNYVSNGDATCTADGTKTAKCDREAC
ncbi:MAG: leucine-rich repeat domain-containing protein, partial [Acutalibacteraceae bacterium]